MKKHLRATKELSKTLLMVVNFDYTITISLSVILRLFYVSDYIKYIYNISFLGTKYGTSVIKIWHSF